MNIRPLDPADVGYALTTWRESHKDSPGVKRASWAFYRFEYSGKFKAILDAPDTVLLGAYDDTGVLLGYAIATRGKRVHTLHWVYVRHTGEHRGRGVARALLEAADLGTRFVYTLRARKLSGAGAGTLDEALAERLARRGITATYVPLKEWLR